MPGSTPGSTTLRIYVDQHPQSPEDHGRGGLGERVAPDLGATLAQSDGDGRAGARAGVGARRAAGALDCAVRSHRAERDEPVGAPSPEHWLGVDELRQDIRVR
jgi:hypothetical protein